jgi:hypothetical protein
MALGVMVRESQCLLPMGRVLRVIEVKDNGGRGFRVACNEMIDERLREPVEVGAGHTVFESGECRCTRQVLRGIERYPLHAERKHGIVPETVGIIASRIARGDLRDPLGEEVTESMVRRRRMAPIAHRGGQAFREADLVVDPAE